MARKEKSGAWRILGILALFTIVLLGFSFLVLPLIYPALNTAQNDIVIQTLY